MLAIAFDRQLARTIRTVVNPQTEKSNQSPNKESPYGSADPIGIDAASGGDDEAHQLLQDV